MQRARRELDRWDSVNNRATLERALAGLADVRGPITSPTRNGHPTP